MCRRVQEPIRWGFQAGNRGLGGAVAVNALHASVAFVGDINKTATVRGNSPWRPEFCDPVPRTPRSPNRQQRVGEAGENLHLMIARVRDDVGTVIQQRETARPAELPDLFSLAAKSGDRLEFALLRKIEFLHAVHRVVEQIQSPAAIAERQGDRVVQFIGQCGSEWRWLACHAIHGESDRKQRAIRSDKGYGAGAAARRCRCCRKQRLARNAIECARRTRRRHRLPGGAVAHKPCRIHWRQGTHGGRLPADHGIELDECSGLGDRGHEYDTETP